MKKLLYTTTAFVLCGGIVQANAACIATPSCYDMGYSSTSSCEGGLKCPFDNYWNCDLANKINEVTTQITELEKKINQQQQQENCVIGSILYDDMTCSDDVVAYKTPIGIVVYLGPSGYQAIALKSAGTFAWGTENKNISNLPNSTSYAAASKDYDSCGNTTKIIAAGDKSTYPAAWAAHEYKTAGTEAGDWCLPAAGIFNSIYKNQEKINEGLIKAEGVEITNKTWSSSEYNDKNVWYSEFSYEYGISLDVHDFNGSFSDGSLKNKKHPVRPVFAF